eukprot:CAMPEP_0194586124 /NCGR_PEP_ID=MMETSP0292-20121207/18221_1 /TAXON_ID=39354 /ORGANISM="Heterosigma akashiwo, Strain CCMP2393" /LENGTH=1684 /DNA_ID=CAMNT_0039441823 /DNA_START=144 /DNA_END=5198 /DNA_ORIENTATION=+
MRKFYLPLDPLPKEHLSFTVEHYQVLKNKLIGQVVFKTSDIVSKATAQIGNDETKDYIKGWYDLYHEDLMSLLAQNAGGPKKAAKDQVAGKLLIKFTVARVDLLALARDGEDTDDGDDLANHDAAHVKTYTAEEVERQSEAFAAEERKEKEQLAALREGDYALHLHVLECRDLQPTSEQSREPSPLVRLQAFGQRRQTRLVPTASNCVFDEHLTVPLRNLKHEDIMSGTVAITCIDKSSRAGIEGTAIGSWEIDFPSLYFKEGHEIFRQWIGLGMMDAVDADEDEENHIRGYVLVSLGAVGPGEDPVVHSEPPEELRQRSLFSRDRAVFPPQIKQGLRCLVVGLHRGEGLPAMDHLLSGRRGVDAQVRIEFGHAGQQVRSRVVTKQGSQDSFDLEFNQEIYLPFAFPTASNAIKLSVYDVDVGKSDEIIATSQGFSLQLVRRFPAAHQAFWANLYGAPLTGGAANKAGDEMNTGVAPASTYRGRLLISLREEKDKRQMEKLGNSSRHLDIPAVVQKQENVQCILRAHVYSGSQLPRSLLHSNRLKVTVAIGPYQAQTEVVANKTGMVTWTEGGLEVPIELPRPTKDLKQLPDVFVYLTRVSQMGKDEHICYLRFPHQELFATRASDFDLTPRWHQLEPDPAYAAVDKATFPGTLLLGIGLARFETATALRADYTPAVPSQNYRLNVYLHMGRDLLPSDRSGALDPYVNIMFGGELQKSETKTQTRAPTWNSVHTFDVKLPERQYLPDIVLEVMDWDRWDQDDFTGRVHVPLDHPAVYHRTASDRDPQVPRPAWLPLSFQKAGDSMGELLVGFELIFIDQGFADRFEQLPAAAWSPLPARRFRLDVLAMGLQFVSRKRAKKPMVEVRVADEQDPNKVFKSGAAALASHTCHWGERWSTYLDLPEDAGHAPSLSITVMEGSMAIYSTEVLGQTTVSLESKLPHSNGQPNPKYIPPGEERLHVGGAFEARRVRAAAAGLDLAHAKGGAHLEHAAGGTKEAFLGDELEGLEYLKGREVVKGDLEADLPGVFEGYPIYAGNANTTGSDSVFDSFRMVGLFKGIIMLTEMDGTQPEGMEDAPQLPMTGDGVGPGNVKTFVVRLYCLSARLVAPPHSGRPYVKVRMGKKTLSTRASTGENEEAARDRADSSDDEMGMNLQQKEVQREQKVRKGKERAHITLMGNLAKKDTSSGVYNLFHCFEFETTMPGCPQVDIKLKDKDAMGRASTLGETMVDLEDRWYNPAWRKLGLRGGDPKRALRPLEVRHLTVKDALDAQGTLALWVEVLPRELAAEVPIVDVEPLPPALYEIRLIIYKTKLEPIPEGDDYLPLQNVYFKAWIGTNPAQKTDTHKQVMDGKAGFNWRMKFTEKLPATGYGASRMFIQAWEQDKDYGNECACEAMYDLSTAFMKASTTGEAVDCFSDKTRDHELSLSKMERDENVEAEFTNTSPMPSLGITTRLLSGNLLPSHGGVGEEKGGDRSPLLARQNSNPLLRRQGSGLKSMSMVHPRITKAAEYDLTDDVEGNADSRRHQRHRGARHKRKKVKKVTAKVRSTFRTIVDIDGTPEGGVWLDLMKRDPETQEPRKQGRVLVSCEIMPKEMADALPAGYGRSEPNDNPFLIEPFGRPPSLKNSLNPIYIIRNYVNDPSYQIYCVYAAVGCAVGGCVALLTYFGLACLAVYVVLRSMGYGEDAA